VNPEDLVYHSEDMQLLGYGESDSSGCWLKFQVLPEDLDKFRGLKGTVFNMTMVKLADSGEPEPKPKGGVLSKRAAMLCQAKDFQEYVSGQLGEAMDEKRTTAWLRYHCDIESRAELDHSSKARERFEQIERDFMRWGKLEGKPPF